MKFEEILEKDSELLRAINDRGFSEATEIQEKSIPAILEGKDVIAGAATGSGKTLAFAAGIVKNVEKNKGIQALVLTPTRELAEQITGELTDFAKYKELNVISVYGGVSIYNQVKLLGAAEVVVATPGRVLDHLEKGSIDFSGLNTLVLDEADRMFDMGFIDDVEKIISECPNKRQTMLFSATISQDVVKLSNRYLKDPFEVSAEAHVDASKLEQVYYDVDDNLKYSLLLHLLESEKSGLIMIFCNTRKNVDFVSNNLKFMDMDVVPIHGGFSQDKRNRFLELFHSEKNNVKILVATDVAARGLDIKGVSHVYNYDIPLSVSEYTHRIGRTARAGKEGKVINLLSSRGYEAFQDIVGSKQFKLKELETPFIKRVRIRWLPEKRDDRDRRRSSMRHERESGDWKKGRGGSGGSRDSSGRGSGGSSGGYGGHRSGGSGGSRGSYGSGDRRGSSGSSYRGSRDGDSRGRSYSGSRDNKGSSGGYRRDNDKDRGSGSYGRSGDRSYSPRRGDTDGRKGEWKKDERGERAGSRGGDRGSRGSGDRRSSGDRGSRSGGSGRSSSYGNRGSSSKRDDRGGRGGGPRSGGDRSRSGGSSGYSRDARNRSSGSRDRRDSGRSSGRDSRRK